MAPPFIDAFSDVAADYVRYRPSYPAALFDHLVDLAPGTRLAWDAAAGSGQVTLALAERFEQVIATDASAEQLSHLPAHPRIETRVERAETPSLEPASVDLATIGAGLHWLDRPAYFEAVRRVLCPGGLFAAWTYTAQVQVTPAIDGLVDTIVREHLADWWSASARDMRAAYAGALPFEPLPAPALSIRETWSVERLLGHIESWSAASLYHRTTGERVTSPLRSAFREAWGEDDRIVEIPLLVQLGRV